MERATVRVVRASERGTPTVVTPGMERQQAYAGEGVWIGTVQTQPGVATGWHHHNDYESFVFVLKGKARMEFGPGGRDVVICLPGDLIEVPRRVIHREVTEGDAPVEAVLFRVGAGEVTTNTEGPERD